jgi:hypothetical protein
LVAQRRHEAPDGGQPLDERARGLAGQASQRQLGLRFDACLLDSDDRLPLQGLNLGLGDDPQLGAALLERVAPPTVMPVEV